MPPLDRKSITEELENLQLEETRDRVETMRRMRDARLHRAARRNQDLKDARSMQESIQAGCWHKKGGKGVAQLHQGSDAHYAVIKHVLSHGPMVVICQRCFKLWEPPPVALNARKASVEDKALYKQLYAEYQWAVNLPTDNETSGTQLFVFTTEQVA
jgi:hypothetical protein